MVNKYGSGCGGPLWCVRACVCARLPACVGALKTSNPISAGGLAAWLLAAVAVVRMRLVEGARRARKNCGMRRVWRAFCEVGGSDL